MKRNTCGRIISAVILGLLLATTNHIYKAKRAQKGRESFIAEQVARFDKHIEKPEPTASMLVVGVFMAGAVIGVYEVIAFGVSMALKQAGNRDDRS
jgi:hypothetical protein